MRATLAALLALVLALRLIGATGYMPSLDHGRLTVVVCPGVDANAPLALGSPHHHHGEAQHDHNQCSYAAAATLGATAPDWAPLVTLLLFALALLLGRTFLLTERHRRAHDRPPSRGPPLPA